MLFYRWNDFIMKKIKIGIDGNVFSGKKTGIGFYSQNILSKLDNAFPDAEFIIYNRHAIDVDLPSKRWSLNIEKSKFYSKLKYQFWLRYRCHKLYIIDNIDIFIGLGIFLPKIIGKTKSLSILYDLNYLLVPETMAKGTLFQHKIWLKKDIMRADKVVAISQGTSERCLNLLGVECSGVEHPSINPIYNQLSDSSYKSRIKDMLCGKRFILAVGSLEPRKQLDILIRTYLSYRTTCIEKEISYPLLVMAGAPGWDNQELQSLIAEQDHDDVVQLGYVSLNDLKWLYQHCGAFVFPSRYEGYGMPVREARLCGAKVFSSDIIELREAGDENTEYFTPDSISLKKIMPDIFKSCFCSKHISQQVLNRGGNTDRHEIISVINQLI